MCRLGSGISSGELRATKCFLLQVSADFTYIHICSVVVSKLEPNSTCRGRNSIQSKLPSFYRDVAARLSLNMYPNASAGNVATVLINNITTQHCELGGEVLQAGEGGATAHINILGPGNHHKSPLQAPSVYVRETFTSFVLHCKSSASPLSLVTDFSVSRFTKCLFFI